MDPIRDLFSGRLPLIVCAVTLLNMAVFIGYLDQDMSSAYVFMHKHGMVPYRYFGGGTFPNGAPIFETWPLLTANFLHTNWTHLLLNTWTLWMFGPILECRLGHLRFLLLYLSCGVASAFTHGYVHPYDDGPLIGASGAIMGVMGAHLVLFPLGRVNVLLFRLPLIPGIPVVIMVLILLGGDFLAILNGSEAVPGFVPDLPEVASWAHIGGFVSGVLIALPCLLSRRMTAEAI
jgi:membrane associated rhomboid family serine protease